MRLGRCRCGAAFHGEMWLSSRDKLEPEHASHPDGAFHADDALHHLAQPLGTHEADACAFLAARLLSEAIERLKELRQLFRIQSRASVADAHADASRRALDAFHLYGALLDVVFDRVGKQVDENLLHPGP